MRAKSPTGGRVQGSRAPYDHGERRRRGEVGKGEQVGPLSRRGLYACGWEILNGLVVRYQPKPQLACQPRFV